jgi:hypothetical protein
MSAWLAEAADSCRMLWRRYGQGVRANFGRWGSFRLAWEFYRLEALMSLADRRSLRDWALERLLENRPLSERTG